MGSVIKVIKVFMKWCTKRGHNKNLAYVNFTKPVENSEVIYLDSDEFRSVETVKLPTPYLERVRDVFCFSCYTGLRFSDVSQLTKKDFKKNLVRVRTAKTKDILTIPLLPQAIAILEKYNYQATINIKPECKQVLKELENVLNSFLK